MLMEHEGRVNAAAVTPLRAATPLARSAAVDALSRIGKKWRLHVLWSVAERPRRFSELLKTGDGMSSFMLAQALRDLEADGLVIRQIVPSRPPRTTYRPSEAGIQLLGSLGPLLAWAGANCRELQAPGSMP